MRKGFLILSVLGLIAIVLLGGCAQTGIPPEKYCEKDSDCVPNDCCRCSDELINKDYINCTNKLCPQLMCNTLINKGIASPRCVNNKCKLVISKPIHYLVYKIFER